MTHIRHHISDEILASYASGALAHPFSMVVAAHVSMCENCRAALAAHEVLGGAVLEDLEVEAVSPSLKDAVFDGLDRDVPLQPAPRRQGIYPGPIAEALKGKAPVWRSVGLGAKQSILHKSKSGSIRLLYIPPGQAMPDHSHGGLEMTMVLQGSVIDEGETFGVGDVEIANEDVDHTPVAGEGAPCICIAATDAPLRFSGLLPRLLQPVLGI